mmetsp:Transcript_32253/g.81220  ORF Transcript_32253/g.81220 Transcript_32253/m.81220 type:complete len:272 (+) Transcript_32253:213-1028(+)
MLRLWARGPGRGDGVLPRPAGQARPPLAQAHQQAPGILYLLRRARRRQHLLPPRRPPRPRRGAHPRGRRGALRLPGPSRLPRRHLLGAQRLPPHHPRRPPRAPPRRHLRVVRPPHLQRRGALVPRGHPRARPQPRLPQVRGPVVPPAPGRAPRSVARRARGLGPGAPQLRRALRPRGLWARGRLGARPELPRLHLPRALGRRPLPHPVRRGPRRRGGPLPGRARAHGHAHRVLPDQEPRVLGGRGDRLHAAVPAGKRDWEAAAVPRGRCRG